MGEQRSEGAQEMELAEALEGVVRQFRTNVREDRALIASLGSELGIIDQLTITAHLTRRITELIYASAEMRTVEKIVGRNAQSEKSDEIFSTIEELQQLIKLDRKKAVTPEQLGKILDALETAATILETQSGQLLHSGFMKIPPKDLPQA